MSTSVENLYRHHTFGDLESIKSVLGSIDLHKWVKYDTIKANSAYIKYGIPRYFDAIIDFLHYMGLVTLEENNEIYLLKKSNDIYSTKLNLGAEFIKTIANDTHFMSNMSFTCFSLNIENDVIELNANLLPFSHLFFIGILYSLDIISKTNGDVYVVNDDYKFLFKDSLLSKLLSQEKLKRKMSLNELLLRQENQRRAGLLAEKFVMEYERKRVRLKAEDINLLSSDFINAGYDIESFNSDFSLFYDRFIEVKSYVGQISFYISRNEIEESKRLGDRYFIYLVNRDEILNDEYAPKIIQNPYKFLFSRKNLTDWIVVEDGRFYKKCR